MASAEEEILQWQKDRDASCRSKDGWLTLAGLVYLKEGENTIGSKEGNGSAIFETPNSPPSLGSFTISSGKYTFSPCSEAEVTVNGEVVKETIEAKTDSAEGGATVFRHGSLSWFLKKIETDVAIRLKDSLSPVLKDFKGLKYFPIDLKYRVSAHFTPSAEPATIKLGTAVGESQEKIWGSLSFKIDGNEYSILTFEDPTKRSMLMFSDATTRKATYGGGRYLWADAIDEQGNTVLDFNRSYSPPCVFTDFATCSRPPKQNKLPIEINAGELTYGA
eukprot:CAMPEP_0201491600 /NCGR_PEP_ID=MMETSP0151_2-20130828/30421_1 /ASSEMBLY_ACC=CAM_ASM_000257 /TAXON_ID=200890 /ORGANISM="Paramoeba atlantica, Strain 621/1 / CCAP 1560/9" /LENGTH=275 /DNA_ID=CAMNT_0047878023 /DNA_START=47 /DNA_END=874 /DNA_ORIENTATION=+